jgi:plastocyanin
MHRGRTVGTVGIVASIVVALVASIGDLAIASGGGGCGKPVTDEISSRVVIHDFCFGPTVARVRPGARVTFVNRDGFSHTVLGANGSWGSFGQIRAGRREFYRFTRPGVYPYVCTYHPGMVGAVVVGHGAPHTVSGTTTGSGPVVQVGQAGGTQLAAGSEPVAPGAPASTSEITRAGSSWAMVLGGMAVLVLLTVGLVAYERRRRHTIAA